jgi:hypothetical protein
MIQRFLCEPIVRRSLTSPRTVVKPERSFTKFLAAQFGVLAVLMTCGQLPAIAEGLLLYVPFDDSPDAAIAGGSAENVGGLGLGFVPGLRGEAAVLRNDCRYHVAGNFRTEQGTVAMWVRPNWSGADPTGHVLFCLYGQSDLPHSWAVNRFDVGCGGGESIINFNKRIDKLFHVRTKTTRLAICKGALVPPIGRFLSKHKAPFIYFSLQSIFPFCVGSQVTVLKKLSC